MKRWIKEISIAILILIAILLVFGVLLYDYIPLNLVITEVSEYEASEEVKQQLKEIATEDTSEIVLTYEISESDLGVYENTKNYDKGKANPFSSYNSGGTTATQNNANASTNVNANNQTQSSTPTNNGDTDTTNSNSASQTTNTFYENTQTK